MKLKLLHYILNKDKEPVAIDPGDPGGLIRWGRWMQVADRHVAKKTIKNPTGEFRVSTVFLGIDHQYGDGPPLLFETMVFTEVEGEIYPGEPFDQYIQRYSTWDEALNGHTQICDLVKRSYLKVVNGD